MKKINKKRGHRIGKKYQAKIPPYDCNYSPKILNDTIETQTFYKCSNNIWNKVEEESFMLGLYIFGKSFVQVKRFIGSKTIGEVQTFYYTKFNKEEYEDHKRRWKVYRKAREVVCIINECEKLVYKETIFTSSTHQYLLSRLLNNNDSVECCKRLLEEFKNFQGKKLTLEDYVNALKDLVGLEALINAFGIGKENDLTILNEDSMKSIDATLEEKDWSKLSYSDIIHILVGNFRMSKSRANDLLQEAIWPSLLANGWHSEQRGCNDETLSSKCTTLFIVPEVEEFPSKLVKGIHYFDSVNDLLAKVVSHPELIKDLASENGSKESTYLPKEASPKGTTIEFNLPVAVEKVEGDRTMVNDVAEIKFDDPTNFVQVSTSENQLSNQDVETLRKSRRLPKPSMKALEAIVNRDVETWRKDRRPPKPSMKTINVVVDRDVETLRTSRRPRKPSMEALEAVVDQDVETSRKSRRPRTPSMKALEAVVDKYEEETSCKRRRV